MGRKVHYVSRGFARAWVGVGGSIQIRAGSLGHAMRSL